MECLPPDKRRLKLKDIGGRDRGDAAHSDSPLAYDRDARDRFAHLRIEINSSPLEFPISR